MSRISHTGVTLPNYKGVDTAITQRPTSTALLAIDSEDRYKDWTEYYAATPTNFKSPYDFVIEKKESLMNGFFTRLGVTEVNFPWVVPNVNRRTNKIRFLYNTTAGLGPFTEVLITLRSGFRTPSQLASELQTIIRAIPEPLLATFTVTYGVFTLGGAIQSAVPIFEFASNNPPVVFRWERMIPNSTDYPFGPESKQLVDLLGLDKPEPLTPTTGFGNFAYGGATFCQAIRYIDIVCSQLVNNQALKDTMSQTVARDTLCRLYIADPSTPSNVPPNSSTFCPIGCAPFQLYRDFSTPKQINWLPNQPIGGSLRFQVFDDNGDLLSEALGDQSTAINKVDWSMTLLVTEN